MTASFFKTDQNTRFFFSFFFTEQNGAQIAKETNNERKEATCLFAGLAESYQLECVLHENQKPFV